MDMVTRLSTLMPSDFERASPKEYTSEIILLTLREKINLQVKVVCGQMYRLKGVQRDEQTVP